MRGLFATDPAGAASGTQFVRLTEGSVFPFGYTPDRVGQTLYFKFLAYNMHGGGRQTLDDVSPYPYTISGNPVTGAVADVGHLGVVYVAAGANLVWDEVEDFRAIRYEIRQGESWITGQTLGSVAHPPFRVPGNGRYWVGTYFTPTSNLAVYSPNPPDVLITGAVVLQNVIAE